MKRFAVCIGFIGLIGGSQGPREKEAGTRGSASFRMFGSQKPQNADSPTSWVPGCVAPIGEAGTSVGVHVLACLGPKNPRFRAL